MLMSALVLAPPHPARAQDDRGYLQALLEDNLSDAGREVRITGFQGALSARATIQELTIADADGVWLTLKGAVLDWDRSALLRGRLEIAELSAEKVLWPRMPTSGSGPTAAGPGIALPDLPSPEARGFTLPELPVSIDIASVSIARVVLGQALFGQATELSLQGSVRLDAGTGRAALSLTRTDGARGALSLRGDFSNATRVLGLSVRLSENADGIAANLIGLPERPSLDLTIAGNGPLQDFTADIALDTDGKTNLKGQVSLASVPGDDATTDTAGWLYTADIGGDLRPLVLPQYRAFLGPELRLAARGTRASSGAIRIEKLNLTSEALRLTGELALGPDYWPSRLALDGRITAPDGGDILLTIPGPETHVGGASLSLRYDAALGDGWTGTLSLDRLRQDDFALTRLRLGGAGTLAQGDGAAIGRLQGAIDISASGIAPRQPDLARAIGPSLTGLIRFDWQENQPLILSDLALTGSDYALSGNAGLQRLQGRLTLTATGAIELAATDLARFSGLTGQSLGGAANLRVAGATTLPDGAFDLRIDGTARDLGIGAPRLDPLLVGDSTLVLSIRRDETGTRIRQLDITATGADIKASGSLKTNASDLRFDLRMPDASLIAPGLNGPANLSGTVLQTGSDWAIKADAAGPGGAAALLDGTAAVTGGRIVSLTGTGTFRAQDLAPYSAIIGRPAGGSLDLAADGQADLSRATYAGTLQAKAQDLRTGIAEADRLLRGDATLNLKLRRDGNGVTVFDGLDLVTPQLIADLTGSISPAKSRLRFNLDLRDIGVYATGLTGPVAAEGVASSGGEDWTLDARLAGPGGTSGTVAGQLAADASRADLSISGAAPLALANTYISPNLASGPVTFDLALNGPLALSSLSGSARTDAARLILPARRIALGNIAATAQLANGQAQIDATSALSTGGRVALSGPIALAPPFVADLAIVLTNAGVSDAGIYETTLDGRLSVRGPLASTAAIQGDLTLGPAEIRVPESGGSVTGHLPGLVHVNEPAAVRQTRGDAGLLDLGPAGGSTASYPLELSVNAPSRIFLRGRGLDAELGGQLRLRGTTANVIADGRFDLVRGRLDILGKRLALSEGYALLQGDFDPFLRIVAETESGGTRIRIVIEGLASAPQISLSSSPELPEDEILSRLLFGRELAQISPFQALRIATAINTLAGGGRADIVSRLRQNFGLDDLDVTTDEAGTTGVRIGKYLSENIYTDITVDSAGKSEINLNLSITPSVTARGKLGSTGDSTLGLFFERDY